MIFYYSATGNSRFAAESLGRLLDSEIKNILYPEALEYIPREDETVGFVFPIYCWGVPPVVSRFVDMMGARLHKGSFVWGVCTCGDEAGIAMKLFSSRIEKARGNEADALFSLIMPNTYVLLPGFDVDKKEVEERKLKDAPSRLKDIAEVIKAQSRGVYDVHQGSMAALRTRMIFPLFEKWGVFPKYWRASDICIGCGKCAAICPARNIQMKDRRPEWGNNCFSCCACFHVCPVNAVSYGKITRGKSQYLCPLN